MPPEACTGCAVPEQGVSTWTRYYPLPAVEAPLCGGCIRTPGILYIIDEHPADEAIAKALEMARGVRAEAWASGAMALVARPEAMLEPRSPRWRRNS